MSPNSPVPTSAIDPGSGTVDPTGTPLSVAQTFEMTLLSIVTAPFRAIARPQEIEAPVVKVILWLAMIFPSNAVPVPSVAELPTSQKTLAPGPPVSKTDELLAVVNVDPILKMNTEFALPRKLRNRLPVSCADDEKL